MKKSCNLFLCVLSLFTLIFIIYLVNAHCTLRQSQEKIKDCYAQHIVKADSMYLHLLKYNQEVVISKQKTNDAILTDSLIKVILSNTQHLTKAQSKKLQLILENHFNQLEQLHNKYEEKLLRDSLRLCTERELLDGQTKTMIDLHLNKVEHEYSNITIWGAVLTILFLVFSFYSMYKLDELINQGRNVIDRIEKGGKQLVQRLLRRLREEGEQSIGETRNTLDKAIAEQQNRAQEIYRLAEETQANMNALSSQMTDSFAEQQNRLQEIYRLAEKTQANMDVLNSQMAESFKNSENNFNAQAAELIKDFKSRLDQLLNEAKEELRSNKKDWDDHKEKRSNDEQKSNNEMEDEK